MDNRVKIYFNKVGRRIFSCNSNILEDCQNINSKVIKLLILSKDLNILKSKDLSDGFVMELNWIQFLGCKIIDIKSLDDLNSHKEISILYKCKEYEHSY